MLTEKPQPPPLLPLLQFSEPSSALFSFPVERKERERECSNSISGFPSILPKDHLIYNPILDGKIWE